MLPNKIFEVFVIKYNYSAIVNFEVRTAEFPTVSSVLQAARNLVPNRRIAQLLTNNMDEITSDDSYLSYQEKVLYIMVGPSAADREEAQREREEAQKKAEAQEEAQRKIEAAFNELRIRYDERENQNALELGLTYDEYLKIKAMSKSSNKTIKEILLEMQSEVSFVLYF